MNSDSLVLRETSNPPLTNKNDFITNADFDGNFIKIYNDLSALLNTTSVEDYDISTTYNLGDYAVSGSKLYQSISASPFSNITPPDATRWLEVFPTILAHIKNADTKLAEGTSDEVTASEIRAFIDAGLTTTTDLDLTEITSTSFKITSSTGADVILPSATTTSAGLLNANDKAKLNQTSGTNTGDQTLASLGAEAVANKATNFDTINNELYPTTSAVSAFLTSFVADEVSDFVGDAFAQKRLDIGSTIVASRSLIQGDESKVIGIGATGLTTPINITLPNNDTTAIVVGSQFMFYLADASVAVNFVAEVESPQVVEIISAGDLVAMDTVGAVVTLVKVATNTWLLTGKLA